MKRVLPLLMGVLLLTGCAAAQPQYVATVLNRAPSVADRGSETEMKELGDTICDSLDDGASPYDLSQRFVDAGWTVAEAGVVVVEAAKIVCPEHADAVR